MLNAPEIDDVAGRRYWLLDHYADELPIALFEREAVDRLVWFTVEEDSRGHYQCMVYGDPHTACLELAEDVRKHGDWWPKALHYLDSSRWAEPITVEVSINVVAISDDFRAEASTKTPAQVEQLFGGDPRFDDEDEDDDHGPVVD